MKDSREIKTWTIASLDGFASRIDGDIDWILEFRDREKKEYGIKDFFRSVRLVVMSHTFYNMLQSYEVWPFAGMVCHIITSQRFYTPPGANIRFIMADTQSCIDSVLSLQQEAQGDIWLAGDHELIGLFMEQGLIDEMTLTVLPVTIGNGQPVFMRGSREDSWGLQSSKDFENGVVQRSYRINRQ